MVLSQELARGRDDMVVAGRTKRTENRLELKAIMLHWTLAFRLIPNL